MDKKNNDLKFGLEKEIIVLDIIKNYWKKDEIKKIENKFGKYDFEGNKYVYELKTRKFNYNKFETTLIPKNKIEENKKIKFLFLFTDGLYYIKYRKNVFDEFETKPFRRYDRGNFDLEKEYIFIPINKLKKIKLP
jgi:hypothetical protein